MKKIVLSMLGALALTATMTVSAANACGYRSAAPCYVQPEVIYVEPQPKVVHCCVVKRKPKPKPRCCKTVVKRVYHKPRPRVRKCTINVNVNYARPSYCY